MCLKGSWRGAVVGLVAAFAHPLWAAQGEIARTSTGRPDLSGTYDGATLTPVERPAELGNKMELTPEEAQKIADEQAVFLDHALRDSDPDREAPAVGGTAVFGFEDGPAAAGAQSPIQILAAGPGAGNTGGYNWFWVDPGTNVFMVDGKFRTSILIDPPNGRMPPIRPELLKARRESFSAFRRGNDGTAWWLDRDGPGPYDDIERRPPTERCIAPFTGHTPVLPSLYNNYKSIVQTEDYVVILLEMIHDARIVRLKRDDRPVEHMGPEVRKWLGDSIGWWEGDTLVVDTTNFRPDSGAIQGGTENTHVVERFTKRDNGDVIYRFTVEDDTLWTASWTGEYVWQASSKKVYEYACHEGNYAMGNIMRGARLLEEETLADQEQGRSR
ncbi:MAG: hypothetical protein VYE73_00925 [Acidobacteriota bacterium]|nr:hypothetical protein [Acidobacteriota bacterium]